MANIEMTSLVKSVERKKSAGRSLASFATSFLLQALVVVILILAPLMATDTLPVPREIQAMIKTPALRVEPPPRPALPRPSPVRTSAVLPIDPGTLVVPMEIPDGIREHIDIFEPVEQPPVGQFDVLGDLIARSKRETEAPKVQEPLRTGGHIQRPQRKVYVAPIYPDVAKNARVEGLVILESIIDPEGSVTNVRVLRSIPLLDHAAVEAVKQWKYEPTLLNGVPVPIVMTITVQFLLG